MQEDKYVKILDYMKFEGLDYEDDEPFILFIDEMRSDFDFTEGLAVKLLKRLMLELKDDQDGLDDYKTNLIDTIEEM